MSIAAAYDPVIPPQIDARSTRQSNSPKSNNKPAQLAYRTKWALDAMLVHTQAGRGNMSEMLRWIGFERLDAKGKYDLARLQRLGELSHVVADLALHVGELERLASDARVGKYSEPVSDTGKGTTK